MTAEEFFIQKNGGKSAEASLNDGETFTAIAMVNFAKEYANKVVEEYKQSLEDKTKSVSKAFYKPKRIID